jgi:hypothetical protein
MRTNGFRAALFTLAAAAASGAAAADEDADVIGYPTIDAALAALHKDPHASFETQHGWTVVASREGADPVQWFFTPEGHPAHPSVVKRTALEERGTGYIELATLCGGPQAECARLLDDFRQIAQDAARAAQPQRVTLDVGIALNNHDRVHVRRMDAEEGKAAEIRMDDQLKIVIVPTLDERRDVTLWTAVYEFADGDYRLLGVPTLARPHDGVADVEIQGEGGTLFRFAITTLLASRE